MTNIILCGGSGTRLWPLSRTLMPKQFDKLFEDRSLFQLTLQRNRDLCEQTIIVSNTDQYFLAIEQTEELISDLSQSISFLLEPIGRNTALAIALACLGVAEDEVVLVTPSDHLIKDPETSHVLPVLMRKIHEAKIRGDKEVEIWGRGKPRREFLYSEDMADACVFIMEKRDFKDIISLRHSELDSESTKIRNTHINIGTGIDISIQELVEMIKKIVGFEGKFYFNTSKPDGTMIKLTDPSKLHILGWKYKVELEDGIRKMYEWYMKNYGEESSLNAES